MKKTHLLLIVALFSISANGYVYGQVDAALERLRNVIPPSPNTSAIGRYSEWPVSLYTGVPDISIPIYEIKGRSIKVPIGISYHASGNRVGDIASSVGLGWVLSAGGLISRSVRGLPDEDSYFSYANTYSNPNDFGSPSNINGGFQKHSVDAANQDGDSQQDIYTLSAMGKSYRLLLKADGSVSTMPASNISIVYNRPDSWTVTLEDGTKLLFGGGNGYNETNNNASYGNNAGGIPYVSSWYLQSITSAIGEVINFTYTSSTVNQLTHFTESDWIEYKSGENAPSQYAQCERLNQSPRAVHAARQNITNLMLSTIESDLTRIEFVPSSSPRIDLQGGVALSQINIFSKLTNRYIDNYQFDYTYSQAVVGSECSDNINQSELSYYHNRLKLVSLKRQPTSSTAFQQWSFQYNTQSLPSRLSYAQDHNGFFNGATQNVTLLPTVDFILPAYPYWDDSFRSIVGFNPSNNHLIGGDRSYNESMMQAEILTQINYPTGGYTKFNFEANRTPITTEQFAPATLSPQLYITANQNPFTNSKSTTFTITKHQPVELSITSSISQSIKNDFPGVMTYAQILDSNGNQKASVSGNDDRFFNLLDPGTYALKIFTNAGSEEFSYNSDNISISATLKYSQSTGTQSIDQMVGGIRIKSIQNFDGNSTQPINERYFSYSNGFVINPIDINTDYLTTQYRTFRNSNSGERCEFTKVTRNTSTKFSLGSIQGGTVGYGTVTTSYGLNGANGRTVSTFTNNSDYSISQADVFPYPPSDPREWQRGLLLSQTEYNASNSIVKQSSDTYSFISKGGVRNFAAGYLTYVDPQQCPDQYQNCGISAISFSISSEQVQHTSSSETSYDLAGNNPITVNTTYYYDNAANMQPVKTVSTNSKDISILTYNRTALEKADINNSTPLSSGASAAIDGLLSKNMVALPVESEKYVNNVLTEKKLLNYQSLGNMILPQELKVQTGNNPIESRSLFNIYDLKGNILDQSITNGPHTSYIWGYNSQYPIAEVKNASLNEVYLANEEEGADFPGWGVSQDASKAHSGKYSGRIDNSGGGEFVVHSNTTLQISNSTPKMYHYSGWVYSNGPSIDLFLFMKRAGEGGYFSYVDAASTGETGKWVYLSKDFLVPADVTQLNLRVDNNGSTNGQLQSIWFDDLRIHPSDAHMTTYTYEPLVGVTSTTDPKGMTTTYEYDSFQRLVNVKDKDGNIVKHNDYHYQNQ